MEVCKSESCLCGGRSERGGGGERREGNMK